MSHAPDLPKQNFHAMMRLDQNRATSQLAKRAKTDIENVTQVTIWGNHSSTQVPDFVNAKINGKPASDVIKDEEWLESDFVSTVQKRGAAIIAARGKSSAASAASAAIDAMKSIITPTPSGTWFSSGIFSNGNPYGIQENIIFSFPLRSKGDGTYEIVKNVPINEFLKTKIASTEKELLEERDLVKDKLGHLDILLAKETLKVNK